MDCRASRSRRGRFYSNTSPPCQPWSFLDSCSSFLILLSLIGVIYLLLDYHCNTCNSSCDLNDIRKSIADIANNVASITRRYQELEMQISRFSQAIPKLEGQFELIEALACAIEKKDTGWDTKKNFNLPNEDEFLKNPCEPRKNFTCKTNCPNLKPKRSGCA